MNTCEAKRRILLHGPGYAGEDGEPMANDDGFLGTLRPYQGLNEDNFHEIMLAILVLADTLRSEKVDRELVHALWDLSLTARAWGLAPGGMLQRNKLISEADIKTLSEWVYVIESTSLYLLRGLPDDYAFRDLFSYFGKHGVHESSDPFIPILIDALKETSADLPIVAAALQRFGSRASMAAPALQAATDRDLSRLVEQAEDPEEVREILKAALEHVSS